METSSSQNGSILWFFRDKGFDDRSINEMFRKCKRLEDVQKEKAFENWAYLSSIGIQERKLPSVVMKCPKILTFGVEERLEPMVQCLKTLAAKPDEVAAAIVKFPYIFSHSVEEKLCPLLAFFEALGIPEKQLGKMILINPRIISYSIELKLIKFVDFLAQLGLSGDGMIGKILVKNPFIMGYSVDNRLQPTVEFLKSVGLTKLDLQRVAVNYPEVLCRDVKKTLEPNFAYLRSCGFHDKQIAILVTGYPPVLIKSIKNSLEPKIKFLVEVMGRRIDDAVNYPEFFRYGLKKTLEFRQRVLTQRNIECSLNEMLSSNQKKFSLRFGLRKELAILLDFKGPFSPNYIPGSIH
ncbi:Transcription termination factor mterf6, chloroplastic/mitochondrial, variant 2 [Ancistrocladus abbreviatus]